MDTIQAQRAHLEEAILECEERQIAIESVETEILQRATAIAEQVESLKKYIREQQVSESNPELPFKGTLEIEKCLSVDMQGLQAAIDKEKDETTKLLEECRQKAQELKQQYNKFQVDQQKLIQSKDFNNARGQAKQSLVDLFVDN